jgi:alkylated DNA repair dioxygenase AlkB
MEFLQLLSVLFKLYRDNNDSVARPRDRESELGNRPLIGSVSFLQKVKRKGINHCYKNTFHKLV